MRLPSTFFHAFVGEVNRWVRVYDYRDAQDRVEYAKECLDEDPESQYELPALEGAIPLSMSHKPFGQLTTRRISDGLAVSLFPRFVGSGADPFPRRNWQSWA